VTFRIRLFPGFGAAAIFIAQPCGCYGLKAIIGPLELGAIEGRWCREVLSVDPEQMIAAQMAAMVRAIGIPAWKAASLEYELPRIMKLPPGERMAAIQDLLEHVNPGMTTDDCPAPAKGGSRNDVEAGGYHSRSCRCGGDAGTGDPGADNRVEGCEDMGGS